MEPGLYRFLRASSWPDAIKRKAGWPNRSSWHYIDYPLRSATSPVESSADKHDILFGLADSEATLRDAQASPADKAIALAWVIHLVGDVHQPLHCATAITPAHPAGDRGGNDTKIQIGGDRTVSLHQFWDDLLGKSRDPDAAAHAAVLLLQTHSTKAVDASGDAKSWALESRQLAQTVAYPAVTWLEGKDSRTLLQGSSSAVDGDPLQNLLNGGRAQPPAVGEHPVRVSVVAENPAIIGVADEDPLFTRAMST